jgi:fluoroquinolone transport system permease protein
MAMNRIMATVRCELELQARNGLYYATGLVLLVLLAALAALPATGLARLLPAVTLNNLAVTAFFFSAAMALLETSEGSATARLVTPLRPGELLAARAATLALLGVIQHMALGLLLLGPSSGLVLLAAGVGLAAAILALLGHALAVGRRNLSEFVLAGGPWLALLLAPMIADVLDWRHPLLWLHPLQGPLVLMRAAMTPVASWEVGLALALALAWAGAAAVGGAQRSGFARVMRDA